jgi:hypothetical protein
MEMRALRATATSSVAAASGKRWALPRGTSSAAPTASCRGAPTAAARRCAPWVAPTAAARRGALQPVAFFKGLFGGGGGDDKPGGGSEKADVLKRARSMKRGTELAPATAPPGLELATFAGGCFWGPQLLFARVPGVVRHAAHTHAAPARARRSAAFAADAADAVTNRRSPPLPPPLVARRTAPQVKTTVGYTDGAVPNPTYEEVRCGGGGP